MLNYVQTIDVFTCTKYVYMCYNLYYIYSHIIKFQFLSNDTIIHKDTSGHTGFTEVAARLLEFIPIDNNSCIIYS